MSARTSVIAEAHIEIRPAQAGDFPQVEAICAQIWEGTDYIPQVWEAWLADADGEFAVLTVDGRVAGLAKLTRMGAREWWLEGLRIDPAYRQQGLGMLLHRHLVERFRAQGGGVARFATGSTNAAVHKMARQLGFEQRAAFVMVEADAQASGAHEIRALAPADAGRVWDFLRASEYFDAAQRSIEAPRLWVWTFLTEARLLDWLAAGRVYGWFGDHRSAALDGVVIAHAPDTDSHDGRARLALAYLDASAGNLAAAAQRFRAVAGEMGLDKVQLKTLARPERLAALEQAGYQRARDSETWLFALESGTTHQEWVMSYAHHSQ